MKQDCKHYLNYIENYISINLFFSGGDTRGIKLLTNYTILF